MQQQIRSVLSRPVAYAMAAALLGAFGLSACGGSSGSSTTHANASAAIASSSQKAGTATPGGTSGARTPGTAPGATTPGGTQGKGDAGGAGARFAAVRECLQRNGVKLPAQPGGGGELFRNLPAGVSRATMQAAVRKCLGGGGRFLHAGRAGALRLKNPAFSKALQSFASCLRQNGVNVPQPNTSGHGPVFSTRGIDTASPQFRKATTKCRGALSAALGVKR